MAKPSHMPTKITQTTEKFILKKDLERLLYLQLFKNQKMKSTKLVLLLVSAILVLVSCSTQKKLATQVKPEDIHDIQQFEPLAYINFIKKGNAEQFNDSLSAISKQLMQKTLDGHKDQIPITGKIEVASMFEKDSLESEIEQLFAMAEAKNYAEIKLTPIIDSLLKSQGKRFGLMTLSSGFTRARYNYGKQALIGLFFGLISMGSYVETPIKANSTVCVMIVDAQENNIVFYKKSNIADGEPLFPDTIEKQIHTIFKKYFWEE
jgi:hypothetical protein